jgi:hypothetical protein
VNYYTLLTAGQLFFQIEEDVELLTYGIRKNITQSIAKDIKSS